MITLFYYTKRKRSFRIKVTFHIQKLRRGRDVCIKFNTYKIYLSLFIIIDNSL